MKTSSFARSARSPDFLENFFAAFASRLGHYELFQRPAALFE